LTKAGSHSSIIFRDASVPYFPAIHGPYDITSQDLDEVAREVGPLKVGESKDIPLKGLVAHIEKTEKDWKASLEIPVKEEAKPAKAAPIAPATPIKEVAKVPAAPAPVAPAPKAVAPKAKAAKSAPKAPKASKAKVAKAETKTEKPVKAMSKRTKKVVTPMTPDTKTTVVADNGVTAQDVNTAVPTGVTLLVGVPTNEEKKGFIERRARREANPDVAVAKNPNAKPDKKSAHATDHGTNHPANHPVSKAAPKSVNVPKAAKVEAAPSAAMAEIVKEDKNLNAKINNPNYPVADKIRDLEAQQAKLRSVKAADQKDLFFSAETIKNRLADLKKAK
jgi:hypothetical protein